MGSTNSIICAFGFLGFIIAISFGFLGFIIALSLASGPLSGTKLSTHPSSPYYQGPAEISRLLDVGARSSNRDPDTFISYVPPLDGTSPLDTISLEEYGMKFVLFDLELINLEAFDAVGGSFTVELQMVLHWEESNATGFSPLQRKDNCSFVCDTTSAVPFCCEDIWVPPLELPGCTINAIQSVTPTPYLLWESNVSGTDIVLRRRFWYLNIDAKCAAKPDFRNFPFDAQKLTIDVINPYASRTWFQLNKGFLKHNVGLGIAGIDLDPDRKSAGWDIKNLLVSSSCGTQQSWQQTFLTQDYLLSILSNQTPTKKYISQQDSIMDALNPEKSLKCAEMKSVVMSTTLKEMLSNPADLLPYQTTEKDYEERFNSTLQHYRDCVESSGYSFYLNTTASGIKIPGTDADFDLSQLNINRSFGLLDFHKDQQPTKVSFQCAIAAVANLTTPGIRITILVQRFRTFYVVKLVVPAVACVLFAFSAFGLEPDDLIGRLTVVVPSAIALTALQGLVVATDIPAVAYIAPTTYIMILSYIVQLFIAFESVFMNCWLKKQNGRPYNPKYNSWRRLDVANEVLDRKSNEIELPSRARGPSDDGQQDNTSMISASNGLTAGEPTMPRTHPTYRKTRKYDIWAMKVLAAAYIFAFLLCVLVPFLRSTRMESTLLGQSTTMWN